MVKEKNPVILQKGNRCWVTRRLKLSVVQAHDLKLSMFGFIATQKIFHLVFIRWRNVKEWNTEQNSTTKNGKILPSTSDGYKTKVKYTYGYT